MFFSAFTELFRRDQSAAEPPPGDILSDLSRVETFPTLSDTATRALAATNDPRATLADLADLIRRDGVLAAAVLKLANSAAYRGRYPTENLPQATNRLGMSGCQRVLAAVAVRGVFQAPTPAVAAACDALLRHALFTGAVAARLNAAGGLGFQGEEFTAGLLHDIGRVVLCARAADAFSRIDPMTFRETAATLAYERGGIGIDHCEVGFLFARANALPPPIAAAIRHHHAPDEATEHGPLVALTAAADALANHVQRERQVASFRPELCDGFVRLGAHIGADAIRTVRKAIPPVVVGALRETRAMLRITDF